MSAVSPSTWRTVFFMPSFYGLAFWSFALAAYSLKLISWNRTSTTATVIFLLVPCFFVLSMVLHFDAYKEWYSRGRVRGGELLRVVLSNPVLATFHGTGLLGLGLYWSQLANHFGSIELVLLALVSESYRIREALGEVESVGIQLSYLGWIAVALTLVKATRGNVPWFWILISSLQLFGNMTFIDRTRPIWIVFVALLTCMALDRGQLSRAPEKLVLAIMLLATVSFVVIGLWVGKIGGEAGSYGDTSLEGMAFSLYLYLTGGFAFANEMFNYHSAGSGLPERTMYPVFRLLNQVGLSPAPPSQLNDFVAVPYLTNVGTFLEPFYADGGLLLVAIGILTHSFVFDFIGLLCLRSRGIFAVYFWANLCFSTLIGFFTPKIGTTPIWLFFMVTIGALAIKGIASSNVQRVRT